MHNKSEPHTCLIADFYSVYGTIQPIESSWLLLTAPSIIVSVLKAGHFLIALCCSYEWMKQFSHNYHITIAPVTGWNILGSSQTVLEIDVLEESVNI